MQIDEDSKVAEKRVGDLEMPEGSLLIAVLREGGGFRARARNGARGGR